MKEKKLCLFLATLVAGIGLSNAVQAQYYITGPACVAPGTTYMYNIQGRWDSSATAKVCVKGGILTDYGKSCASGTEFSYAKIKWDGDVRKGKINLECLGGTASLAIQIIEPFSAGQVDTLIKIQSVDTVTVPAVITCSAASGGSCAPQFIYQWQQSANDMEWTDVDAATNQDLKIGAVVKQSSYYRRKVTDSSTGSANFSDEAIIIITGK